jgi:hypothetical protein
VKDSPIGDLTARKDDLKAALWKLMDDPHREVYEQACVAMPKWAEAGDSEQVLKWLNDKRPEASKAAAVAAGRLKLEAGLAVTQEKFLKDPDGYVDAVKEYGDLAAPFLAAHQFDEHGRVRELCGNMLQTNPNAAKLAVEPALQALSDPKRRELASNWLEKADLDAGQKTKAIAALVKMIDSKPAVVPPSAGRALLKFGDERGLAVVAEGFPRDPDGTLKAMKALGAKAEPYLAQFLFDGDEGRRNKAGEALKDSPNRDKLFVEGAKAALASSDSGRHARAMDWLEKAPLAPDQKAAFATPLAKALSGRDGGIADRAAKLLAPMVTKDQTKDLTAAILVHGGATRKAILDMIQKLGDEAALPGLTTAYKKDPASIAPVLASFGEKGEMALAPFLFDPNNVLRGEAEKALAASPRKDALALAQALVAVRKDSAAERKLPLAWMSKTALTPEQMKLATPALREAIEKSNKLLAEKKAKVPLEDAIRPATKNPAPELVPLFAEAYKNPAAGPTAHKLAMDALATAGDEKAVAVLMAWLDDPKPNVGGIFAALKKMKAAEAPVRAFLSDGKYKKFRGSGGLACGVLGAIGTAASIPALEAAAKMKDLKKPADAAIAAIKKRM